MGDANSTQSIGRFRPYTAVAALAALFCLLLPLTVAAERTDCPNQRTTWGVADPIVQDGGDSTCGNHAQIQETKAPPPPPPSTADVANGAANSVKTMTGTTFDSQNNVQAVHKNMTSNGGGSSREVGTMDLLEAILLLPLNPGRAAKLMLSGQQSHDAAGKLEAVAAKAEQNANLMKGTSSMGGGGNTGVGAANAEPGRTDSSGASSPMNSERAGELFGQLDSKYGMGRDDFVNGVNSVKGDPEAVGVFMHEATGDPKIGKDAVNGALDAYAAELGVSRNELYAMTPAPATSAPPATPAPVASTPSAPKLDTTVVTEASNRQPASAKEVKESLRDKLKKALAERQSGSSIQEPAAGETLLPIKDQFFENIKAQNNKELTLFDVVRSKYAEKWPLMLRRPTP